MKRSMKLVAGVLALALTGGTAAQAACNQSHVNNKTWKATAHEVTSDALILCTFKTNGSGAIGNTAKACENSQIGVSTDFDTPAPATMDIKEGSVTLVPGDKCVYDAILKLDDGTKVLTARVVMESGKTTAIGNFLLTGDGGGTIALLRQ